MAGEDELIQLARRYASLLEQGPIGVFEVQLDGIIRFANTALAVAAGHPASEALIGKNILDYYVDPAQRAAMLSELSKAGSVHGFGVTMKSAQGEIRHLLLSAVLSGDVLRGISVDATELHDKERELRETLELNRRILEVMPGGVVHVLANGSITHANAEALRVLGLSRDRLTQRYTRDFDPETIHEDGTHCSVEHYPVTQALLTGKAQPPHTIGVKRPDGEVSWAVFRATPVLDPENGSVTGAVVAFIDISERKRAEERVRALEEQVTHAQKLESLGLMAGGIAHDFNNLLSAIMGNASLAKLQLASGQSPLASLEAIQSATERAADLTRQMLTFAGRRSVEPVPLSLSEAVSEMAELLSTVISKRATLRLELEAVPPIDGDRAQLHQVVMNLILNASDALDRTGVIRVATSERCLEQGELASTFVDDGLPAGSYVTLEVSDTGGGMDETTRRRIFDPFFTTKATGRGLGLAATLGIVRAHKGAIDVSSTPGRGTTFRVHFPRSLESSARSKQTTRSETKIGDGATVLVVDDEPAVRDVTRRLLEECGYDVRVASDGTSGIEAFSRERDAIAVVLLDLTMTDMSGLEVLSKLEAIRPGVRVVLASGYSAEEVGADVADKANVTFLHKPFTLEALSIAVEHARTGRGD